VAFWQATADPQDRISQCLRFILLMALRAGEAGKLDWQWVESDRFTIPKTKNGRAHALPLSSQARAAIETRRNSKLEKQSGPVFDVRSDVLGQRIRDMLGLSKNDQTRRKRELRKSGGTYKERKPRNVRQLTCQPFTPHDLRRTALTTLARLGCPLQVIQKIANHAPSGVTQQVYLRHSFEIEAREWLDKLGAYIDSLANGKVASLEEARSKREVAA
jgi:integrase